MKNSENIFPPDRELKRQLKSILGLSPSNINLYKQALKHSTVADDLKHNGHKNSNERLEFLGDAILNSVVAEMVFLKYPYRYEGFLTQMRSKIVSRESLNKLARKIGLDQLVMLEKRNFSGGVHGIETAYGNAMEAIIGAVYLDKGFKKTQKFVIQYLIKNHMDIDNLEQTENNYKSKLLEWAQRTNKEVKFEEGPVVKNGNHKLRHAFVWVDGVQMGEGKDHVKKKAEQVAAQMAWEALGMK